MQHFTEIIEDQFDFHTYCMRKMTLRSYVDLLRLEDVLRSQRFYERAAHCAIRIYLGLHDKPVTDDDNLSEYDADSMDPSELKKLRNKQKKAKRKAELEKQQQKQQLAKQQLHNKSAKKASAEEELDAPAKDELNPEKLERPEEPLAEAIKFLLPLQQLSSKKVETHVLAFEIYWRKRRPLLMLQCLKRALKLDDGLRDDPGVHECLVRFQKFVEDGKFSSDKVRLVLEKETKGIFEGLKAKQRNDAFAKKHAKSLPHAVAGLIAVLLGNENEF